MVLHCRIQYKILYSILAHFIRSVVLGVMVVGVRVTVVIGENAVYRKNGSRNICFFFAFRVTKWTVSARAVFKHVPHESFMLKLRI